MGTIWGGEFFVGDYRGFRRVAHLEPLPMPGGEAAIRQPWRLAVGYLYALTGRYPTLQVSHPGGTHRSAVQVDRRLNTPLTRQQDGSLMPLPGSWAFGTPLPTKHRPPSSWRCWPPAG